MPSFAPSSAMPAGRCLLCSFALLVLLGSSTSNAFQQPSVTTIRATAATRGTLAANWMTNNAPEQEPEKSQATTTISRRSILSTAAAFAAAVAAFAPLQNAHAGIDVSGIRSDGGGNPALVQQLRAIDGSASSRVNQLKEIAPVNTGRPTGSPVVNTNAVVEEQGSMATWLYRASPGFNPRLSRAGALGTLYKYEDQVVAPSKARRALSISFEFPSDWLQLDKFLGGISYVDQRNGDRLWLLRTKLPEGERLASVPKSFLGTSIFDPKGTLVKSGGIDIDDYKVASATLLNDGTCDNGLCGATHRRFKVKYSTVTGNGLRVERRGLVDAYEVSPEGDVYMLMTSSNAVKFDNKDSLQRQTVEAIVDSFQIIDL